MPKQARTNPVTQPLSIVASIALVLVGLSALMKWDVVLDAVTTPLLFVCSLLVLTYCGFAVKLGEIGSISQTGKSYRHKRSEEPLSFYFLLILYTSLALATAWYLLSRALADFI